MKTRTTLALLYDFDKTLTTKDMQEYTFIPNMEMSAEEFWSLSNDSATAFAKDRILSYMYQMVEVSKKQKKEVNREAFVKLGRDLEFYPGVEAWFNLIKQHADALDLDIKHYVISSGLKEIIEGSSIYPEFDEVYACEFFYDEDNFPVWPKNVVNYTTKTQFLYRINKGVLDISDDESLNTYTPEHNRPVPFSNMIYIGDGMTDVPAMKLVKVNGGHSIAVYSDEKKHQAQRLLLDQRVNFITTADYREDSTLHKLISDLMQKIKLDSVLLSHNQSQVNEAIKDLSR